MRRMRRDVISFLLPLTLPLAMIAFSLCGSFGFKTAEQSARPPAFAAFVELSPEAEARATAAVKAAWQGDSGGIKRIRADLSVGELPEEVPGPVLEVSPEAFRIPGSVLASELPPLPPSMRAPPPRKIRPPAVPASAPPAVPASAPPAFTREELLKID